MKVNVHGEDGFTLYFLAKETEKIKKDLELKTIDRIWFRPSFGRGSGTKSIGIEIGYSGFGEPDALLFGQGTNNKTVIVFIESKRTDIIKSTATDKDLKYQFFLKLCMVFGILNEKIKKMGKKKEDKIHYCTESINEENPLSCLLSNFYEVYKGKNYIPRLL